MQTITAEAFKKRYGEEADVLPSLNKSGIDLLAPAKESLAGLGELYGGGEKGIANKLKTNIQEGVTDIQRGIDTANPLPVVKGIVKTGARVAGDVGGTVYAPVGAVLGATGINKLFDFVGKVSQMGGKYNPINAITDLKAVQDFVAERPNLEEDFSRALNIAMAGLDKGKIDPKTVVQRTIDQVKSAAPKLPAEPIGASKLESGVKAVDNILDKAPANIMQRVARIPKGKQASFEQMAGESVGQYLTKRGIYGNVENITSRLYERFSKSKAEADTAFEQLPGNFKPEPIKTALNELKARETRVSSPGAISKDLGRVNELLNKLEKEGLTMPEINEVKRLFERNVRVDYIKSAASNPEGVARATNLDSAIREWQFSQAEALGLKNLPEINKETRLAKQLLDDLGQEYAGSAGNNAVTLTDWILLAGGNPANIGAAILKKGASSPSFQSAIAKWLSKDKPILQDIKAQIEITPENIRRQVSPQDLKALPPGKKGQVPTIEAALPARPAGTIEPSAIQALRTTFNKKTGDIYIRDLKTGQVKIIKGKKR